MRDLVAPQFHQEFVIRGGGFVLFPLVFGFRPCQGFGVRATVHQPEVFVFKRVLLVGKDRVAFVRGGLCQVFDVAQAGGLRLPEPLVHLDVVFFVLRFRRSAGDGVIVGAHVRQNLLVFFLADFAVRECFRHGGPQARANALRFGHRFFIRLVRQFDNLLVGRVVFRFALSAEQHIPVAHAGRCAAGYGPLHRQEHVLPQTFQRCDVCVCQFRVGQHVLEQGCAECAAGRLIGLHGLIQRVLEAVHLRVGFLEVRPKALHIAGNARRVQFHVAELVCQVGFLELLNSCRCRDQRGQAQSDAARRG